MPAIPIELVPQDTYARFKGFVAQEFGADRKEVQEVQDDNGSRSPVVDAELVQLANVRKEVPTLTQAQFKARYRFVRQLGKGGFGRVDVYLDQTLGKEVAVKTMLSSNFRGLVSDTKLEYILNRIYGLTFPGDQGLARCLDLFILQGGSAAQLVMVQELACCGNLQEFLASGKARASASRGRTRVRVTNRFLWCVAFQALKTLYLMHSIGLMHNDIKPANMVWDPATWHLTLVDLGIGCLAAERVRQLLTSTPVIEDLACEERQGLAGTPLFMAPESLSDSSSRGRRRLDPARDVFALGVSLYQIGTLGLVPYTPSGEYLRRAKTRGQPMPFKKSPQLSQAMNSFCARLAAWNPADRPTVLQALDMCIANIELFSKSGIQ